MGEHDTNDDDEHHEDIKIDRVARHSYDVVRRINDVALLFLERDVEFTGELYTHFMK